MSMAESEPKKFLVHLAEQRQTLLEINENVKWIEEKLYLLQEELEEYRAIGTVSEFRELKEKATAKKPIEAERNNLTVWYCPKCGNELYSGQKFCDECGNAIADEFE